MLTIRNPELGLIDLARYPIDRLDSQAGTDLIKRCHQSLATDALCALPGFIRAEAIETLRKEVEPLLNDVVWHDDQFGFAYDDWEDDDFPPRHPRRRRFRSLYKRVLNYAIPNDALFRRLYLSNILIEFVRRVFGAASMYPSQCPHLSLTLKVEDEGDTDAWHYDSNDGVVSLLLQQPDAGGEFEYAPYIRSEQDECYDQVAAMLDNPGALAKRPLMAPGTFVFFNGKLSLHRVRPVGRTAKPRVIGLLSYDRRPDYVSEQPYIKYLSTLPRKPLR